MSSAQQAVTIPVDDSIDEPMLEAPDSPPDFERGPTQTSAVQPATSQSPNTSRANGDGSSKINFGAPGSSWQTKKFNEEYEKMEGSLLDKNWEQKYGDPLLQNRLG